MLIIDECERLPTTAIELIRDIFDRTGVGVILIGMPGLRLEKRLSRYPQLFSRVGPGLRSTTPTSPTPKRSLPLHGSPAGTSGCCIGYSCRSGASSRPMS